jgi:hypothetical protein
MGHGIENLPPALKRWKTTQGFISMWRKTVSVIYSPRVLSGLPPFAEKAAKTFWEVDPGDAVRALRNGDVAFFIACLVRVDQIDTAMVRAGRTIADRSPLIRCRMMLDGFLQASVERLKELGGEWPLSASGEPGEAPA